MRVCSSVLVLGLVTGCALAQGPLFGRLTTSIFDPGDVGGALAAGDFDGDGDLDLLIDEAGDVVAFRNDGPGRFVRVGATPGATPDGALDVGLGSTADVDGDGDLDVALGGRVLLGDGALGFVAGFATGEVGGSALFDADGDGDADLLVNGQTLRLFANDGAGAFSDVSATALPTLVARPTSWVLCDVDGDADRDLVFTEAPYAVVHLWRNQGGVFAPEVLQPGAWFLLATVGVADLDADGDPDLMIAPIGAPAFAMRNDGSGAFTHAAIAGDVPGWEPAALGAFGDWDQDGDDDLVTPEGVFLLDGDARFVAAPFPLPERWRGFVALADLDGDLDLDVLTPASTVDAPQHLLNTTLGPVGADRRAVRRGGAMSRWFSADDAGGGLDRPDLLFEGDPGLLWLRGDVHAGGADERGYFRMAWLSADGVTDAAVTYGPSVMQRVAVLCTDAGPALYGAWSNVPEDLSALLPPIGAPTRVAVGDLVGDVVPELVFGDTAHPGPRILTRVVGGYADQSPLLPPATPSSAPAAEAVVVVDVDGDGDRDVVHELRVVRNDGAGQWSVGADLSGLVAPATSALVPIDYDGDGDADLLCHGAGAPTLLLRNDGAAFVDVTIGVVPPAAFAPSDRVSVGDVDGDGDDDWAMVRAGATDLLRNDGGTFTRIAAVGPPGVLVDADRDGRADLFTGDDVLWSLHSNLHAPRLAVAGGDWRLEVRSWRVGGAVTHTFLAVGTAALSTPVLVPGAGQLLVDLAHADVFALPTSGGAASWSLPIPSTPLVLGVPLVAQALLLDGGGMTLTNALRHRVR